MRFTVLIVLQLLVGSVLGFLIWNLPGNSDQQQKSTHSKLLKESAGRLHAAGVLRQAASQYQAYLQIASIGAGQRAQMALALGDIYEQLGEYERALTWYYQVEIADATTNGIDHAREQIVAILERLKKFSAAKNELSQSTTLDTTQLTQVKGAKVVAKIENSNIYDYQVNQALDLLPKQLKKSMEKDNAKFKGEFLTQYVANQLLYGRAERLQLQKRPKVRERLALLKRQLLVEELIDQEVKRKIEVNQSDLKNYFIANQDRFAPMPKNEKGKKEKKRMTFEQVKDGVEQAYRQTRFRQRYQELVTETMKSHKVEIYQDRYQ